MRNCVSGVLSLLSDSLMKWMSFHPKSFHEISCIQLQNLYSIGHRSFNGASYHNKSFKKRDKNRIIVSVCFHKANSEAEQAKAYYHVKIIYFFVNI